MMEFDIRQALIIIDLPKADEKLKKDFWLLPEMKEKLKVKIVGRQEKTS